MFGKNLNTLPFREGFEHVSLCWIVRSLQNMRLCFTYIIVVMPALYFNDFLF